jgi:hypothetical protein
MPGTGATFGGGGFLKDLFWKMLARSGRDTTHSPSVVESMQEELDLHQQHLDPHRRNESQTPLIWGQDPEWYQSPHMVWPTPQFRNYQQSEAEERRRNFWRDYLQRTPPNEGFKHIPQPSPLPGLWRMMNEMVPSPSPTGYPPMIEGPAQVPRPVPRPQQEPIIGYPSDRRTWGQ